MWEIMAAVMSGQQWSHMPRRQHPTSLPLTIWITKKLVIILENAKTPDSLQPNSNSSVAFSIVTIHWILLSLLLFCYLFLMLQNRKENKGKAALLWTIVWGILLLWGGEVRNRPLIPYTDSNYTCFQNPWLCICFSQQLHLKQQERQKAYLFVSLLMENAFKMP